MTVFGIKAPENEGDKCSIPACRGTVDREDPENCSCHINSPCSSCVDAPLVCNVCGETFE